MRSYGARQSSLILVGFFVALLHAFATVALFATCVPKMGAEQHWWQPIGVGVLALFMFPLGWLDTALLWMNSPVFGVTLLQSPLIGVVAALLVRSRRRKTHHIEIGAASTALRSTR